MALPLLYIFRLADFFDQKCVLSNFISSVFKVDYENTFSDDENQFLQVKLFYYAIYILFSILLFFETIDYIYKFFIKS